jgi:hypothetical protein
VGSGNDKLQGFPEVPRNFGELPPEQQARVRVEIMAQMIFDELKYIEGGDKTLDHDLQHAAIQAARDVPQMQQLMHHMTPAERKRVPLIELEVMRASPLEGVPPKSLMTVCVPQDFAECKQTDQVFTLATIFALIHDPLTRARLYLHGYRLNFAMGSAQGEGSPNVVPFRKTKKRKR